jgi:hypothetical protein
VHALACATNALLRHPSVRLLQDLLESLVNCPHSKKTQLDPFVPIVLPNFRSSFPWFNMVDAVKVGSTIVTLLPLSISRYKRIYEGAKVAKRCRQELEYLYKDLKVQHKIFVNECKALIGPGDGQNGDMIHAAMFADTSHEAWDSDDLAEQLKTRLPTRYRDCKDVLKRILEEQDRIIHQLEVFDPVRTQKAKVSTDLVFDCSR